MTTINKLALPPADSLQASHASDDAHRTLASIMYLCTQTDGTRGIWKRIDENRELVECILKY